MPETIIIGAGLTGLSAAWHMKTPYLLLEKNSTPGGLCGSVTRDGFTFDYSGHLLHLKSSRVKSLLESIMPVSLASISRKASVFTHGRMLPYPFQANLLYLPENIRKECLNGFLRTNPPKRYKAGTSFFKWSSSVFGKGITKYFMKPYNEKLWTVPAGRLTADWVAPFVPIPDRGEIIAGASGAQTKDFGYNICFYYPRAGGCQSLSDAFTARLNGNNVKFGVAAGRIDLKKKSVRASDGKILYFKNLVSTQPLVELLENIENLPPDVAAAAKRLDWNSVYCLNLAFKDTASLRKPASGRQWVYFPEGKYVFYRAGVYTNIQRSLAPEGYFSMYVEISMRPGAKFNLKPVLERTLKGLSDAGIIETFARPELVSALAMPYAYVIFDKYRQVALNTIMRFLERNGVHSIGRYGAWEYSFMESNIISGQKTAEMLNGK